MHTISFLYFSFFPRAIALSIKENKKTRYLVNKRKGKRLNDSIALPPELCFKI